MKCVVGPTCTVLEGAKLSTEELHPSLRDFGPITAGVRALWAFAKWLSPMQWLGSLGRRLGDKSCLYLLRPRSDLTQLEIESKDFTRRRACAIEWYMVCWLGFEVAVVVMACLGPWPTWTTLAAGLVALRIIEILQITVNATLFDAFSGRPDERVASQARMLVLAGLNFVELCLCFGVIYASDLSRLHGAGRPITAFYFSIITQLTIGYGDIYPVGHLRLVAAAHGLTSILFVVLVFGRFVAALPRVRAIFWEKQP